MNGMCIQKANASARKSINIKFTKEAIFEYEIIIKVHSLHTKIIHAKYEYFQHENIL